MSPSNSRKIVVHEFSTDFRKSTKIVDFAVPELKDDEVLVRNKYVGINATDINHTNGAYVGRDTPLPIDTGFEGAGEVVQVGKNVTNFKIGQPVMYFNMGAYAEHVVLSQSLLVPIPFLNAEFIPLIVSGLTASIALEQAGQMKSGQTVLVTAAAGGTGQFAVQLAKLAGNHVIGTCSSQEKVDYLKSLGCDRVINYRSENLSEVLQSEYPSGVDLVYECVGGETFDIAVDSLAQFGKIVVIGAISGYQSGGADNSKKTRSEPVEIRLLKKSASVVGFMLPHYASEYVRHSKKLSLLKMKGLLAAGTDPTSFVGLESVPDAIDHMYERKNIGKVVVTL